MNLLGIPLWPKPLSDEEYIARIRKSLRVARRFRWLQAVIGLAMLAMAVWALIIFVDLLSVGSKASQDQHFLILSFAFAILLGVIVGLWFVRAGHTIANALCGCRRDRMLVECWDALHKEKTR